MSRTWFLTLTLIVCLWPSSFARAGQSVKNETKGTCANIFNDNHGTITIHCPGLSPQQLQQITSLLQGISQVQRKDQDVLLQKLSEVLAAVKAGQTVNPNVGYTIYKCNGWASISDPGGPGMFNFNSDPGLVKDFQMMISLTTNNKAQELLTACKKEIADHPEWLTPYLLCAMSSFNLGQGAQARDYFQSFENKRGDAYKDEPCLIWEARTKEGLIAAGLIER